MIPRTETLRCFFFIATFAALLTSADAQVNPLDFVNSVLITDNDAATNEIGRDRASINSTAFKNESLWTTGNYQFGTYYREDGKLMVVRRDLTNPVNDWDIVVTEFTSYNINDAHNVPVIGVDGDGYLHLAWGTHANPLLYTRSTTPVTSGQPMSFIGQAAGNGGAPNTMTGTNETRTTYPNFIPIPGSDDLLFNYRTGGSGNGTYRITHWDDSANTWSWQDETWIRNSHAGSSLTYNAYPHNLTYDSNGGLHATWTFRYNSSSPTGNTGFQTNHNIYYAYSPDDGVTWYKDIDGTVPYTADIDESNAEIIVPIPEGSSLINTGTQAVDVHDRPAIATWWAPRANDPTPDHRRQYMYVGHDGNDWFTSQITHRISDDINAINGINESSLGVNPTRRPAIVIDDYNRAYVLFNQGETDGKMTVAYSQAESRDDWEFIELDSEDLRHTELTIDRQLWESSRKLHVFVQKVDGNSSNGGTSARIVEWDVAAAMGRVLNWTGAASADFNGTDVNFTDLGTPDDFDDYDHVNFTDAAAQKTINFQGNVDAGKVVVDTSQAYTFTGSGALTSGSLSVVGGGSLELATSGNSYSGPTRVANATLVITGNANAMTSTIIAADRGTVIMDASDASSMASEFEIWPTGTLEIGTPTSTGNVFPNSPAAILNDGLIRVHQNATLQNMSGHGRVEALGNTTTLQQNNGFNGTLSVHSGAVAVINDGAALGTSQSSVDVHAGGELRFAQSGSHSASVNLGSDGAGGGLLGVAANVTTNLTGDIHLGNASPSTIDVGENSVATITRPLTGTVGLTKQGSGTLRLSGINSYTGPTVVGNGTLIVDSVTGVGDTLVESGGTFESGGVVRGNLSVEAGGIVQVGNFAAAAGGVIYEERFSGNGSSSLNGLAPDTVSSGQQWSSHSSIGTDGQAISIVAGGSATLPIDIQDGYEYVLDANFQNVVGDADWFAIGFLEGMTNGSANNGNRFIADPTTGKAWMIFRGDNTGNTNNSFTGNASSGTAASAPWSAYNTSGGDIHLRILLDTTNGAGNYTAEYFAKLPTDIEYTSVSGPLNLLDENIGAVGFAVSQDDVVGDIDFFRLRQEGIAPADPQALLIEGDFDLASGAILRLEYTDSVEYERVVVTGTLEAGGSIIVSPVQGAQSFVAGSNLDLLDFGSLSGMFESIELPTLSIGLVWDNTALLTDGVVSVVEGLAGDFNGDNQVDLADYTAWRNSLGAHGVGLAGDANGDLNVDGLDYQIWRANFGQILTQSQSNAQVPEPSTWGLILCCWILVALRKGQVSQFE